MTLVTIGKHEDIDLAVPPLTEGQPSGVTLREIADGYSKWVTPNWSRAVNVEYRAGPSGPSVSLVAEGGKIWTRGDPRWPVMLMKQTGAVIKNSPTDAEIKAARWAFSAGPWLIRDGLRCNLTEEIARGGYTGLSPSLPRERAGIGIRPDGLLVHVADMSLTLDQLADRLIYMGCHSAINLDGGGSVGVVDPTGGILLGYSARQVCCALIFKQLDERYSTSTEEPEGGKNEMIVCIDPGHGGPDSGAIHTPESIREKDITLNVSLRLAEYLRRDGVKVILTRETDTDVAPGLSDDEELEARGEVSNKANADYFISIHVDSHADDLVNGSTVYHWPGSTKGSALAGSISRSLSVATGFVSRGIKGYGYAVLGYADAPAVLVELGYLSNRADRWCLREPAFQDKCALALAFGILQLV